jgi:hypothetical protein
MAAPAVYAAGLIEFPPRPGTLTKLKTEVDAGVFVLIPSLVVLNRKVRSLTEVLSKVRCLSTVPVKQRTGHSS